MLFLLCWSGCARPINRSILLCLAFNETVFYPLTLFEDKISFVSLFFPLILGSILFIPDPVSYLIRYVLFVRLFLTLRLLRQCYIFQQQKMNPIY